MKLVGWINLFTYTGRKQIIVMIIIVMMMK